MILYAFDKHTKELCFVGNDESYIKEHYDGELIFKTSEELGEDEYIVNFNVKLE